MRTCEVLVLNFQFDSLSQENFRSFFSGFDSRLATRHSPVCVVHGGLAQMVERSLRMRQARGSMPLSSTPCALHMNSNLRFQAWLAQSVERTTLTIFDVLANAVGCCDRVVAGSIPASGARSSAHGCVGTLRFMSQSVPRKNARQTRVRVPARETNKYTATYAVPRSLGGQDSRFSLSQLCVAHAMQTLIFFARKHPHWAWPFDWVRLPACDTPPLLVWFSWS